MHATHVIRSRSPLATPLRLERAFTNPGAVLDLVHRGCPYATIAAIHREPDLADCAPWFRNFWALGGKVLVAGAEPFFRNPRFIAAARQAFGAEVIRPWAMMTNLNFPAPGAPPHLDLPFFRGLNNREIPGWMLAPMGYSGLFHDWAIPVASAITWFYDGPGGAFEYWPAGPGEPSCTVSPPFRNHCVVADNEYMYHRVGATGSPQDPWFGRRVPYRSRLDLSPRHEWLLRHGDKVLARLPYAMLRVSVLWKAFCFRTRAIADSYDDPGFDLTPTRVVTILCDDLRRRGITFAEPVDLATDRAWRETVLKAYPAPCHAASRPRRPGHE